MAFPSDYYVNLETRSEKELVAGVFAKTFWGEKMLLSHVLIKAGAVVPLHHHEHEQIGIVLEGEMTITIDGDQRIRILKAGDSFVIPGNVPHTVTAHAGDVRLVDVFSPVREEYQYE